MGESMSSQDLRLWLALVLSAFGDAKAKFEESVYAEVTDKHTWEQCGVGIVFASDGSGGLVVRPFSTLPLSLSLPSLSSVPSLQWQQTMLFLLA